MTLLSKSEVSGLPTGRPPSQSVKIYDTLGMRLKNNPSLIVLTYTCTSVSDMLHQQDVDLTATTCVQHRFFFFNWWNDILWDVRE